MKKGRLQAIMQAAFFHSIPIFEPPAPSPRVHPRATHSRAHSEVVPHAGVLTKDLAGPQCNTQVGMGEVEAATTCASEAQAGRFQDVDSVVERRHFSKNVRAPVRGTIVHADDFDVAHGLVQEAPERIRKHGFVIIYGNNNA